MRNGPMPIIPLLAQSAFDPETMWTAKVGDHAVRANVAPMLPAPMIPIFMDALVDVDVRPAARAAFAGSCRMQMRGRNGAGN